MFLSVIIPVYNEDKNIAAVLQEHALLWSRYPKEIVGDWELVCLNDASTDQTAVILKEIASKNSHVRILINSINQGITPSFLRLIRESHGTHIYMTAGDGQWPAENLARLLSVLQETKADLVVGVREQRMKVYNPWRSLLSYGFNLCAYLLFGVRAKDANGIKLGRREVFDIPISCQSFFSEIERLIEAKKKQYVITYAPVLFLPRIHGKERGGNFKNIVSTFKDMFVYRFKQSMRIP
ncbi:MAG: glycosyltransferase family 2 protein [Candidatus Omnitrophica bacterium]|nr:glycosyltransferase family 2 protein [Candidatus Omnitrophota bacterium]